MNGFKATAFKLHSSRSLRPNIAEAPAIRWTPMLTQDDVKKIKAESAKLAEAWPRGSRIDCDLVEKWLRHRPKMAAELAEQGILEAFAHLSVQRYHAATEKYLKAGMYWTHAREQAAAEHLLQTPESEEGDSSPEVILNQALVRESEAAEGITPNQESPGNDPIAEVPDIGTEEIFVGLGFAETADGFSFEIDGERYSLIRGLNDRFVDCYSLLGTVIRPRTMAMIGYSLPLRVRHHLLGIALLAYPFKGVHLNQPPDWLQEGLALDHYLPWNMSRAAYEARPKCMIDREWIRVAAKRLRDAAAAASPEATATFMFTGEALRIAIGRDVLHLTASGEAWTGSAEVEAAALQALPRRWSNPTIAVDVWDGRLRVGNRAFKLCATPKN